MFRTPSRFIILALAIILSCTSCSIFRKKSAAEKAKEAQREKEYQEKRKQEKAFKKAQDYHYSLQSPEVRRRLKKHRKEATTPFNQKEKSIWRKIFGDPIKR